jgi:hypothetical protein
MSVGISGIGDIVALIKIVQGVVVAVDGATGSAAEYQELKRELTGLEDALTHHQSLLQARQNDPALDAIFRTTEVRAADCKKCIEAFSKQTVKYDKSLGIGQGHGACRDIARKVRWHMEKSREVVRFREELSQHILQFNMLFGLANL